MKNRINKYILSLCVIMLAVFGRLHSYSVPSENATDGTVVTKFDTKHSAENINPSSLLVFEKEKSKFTTNDNDNEEELSGPVKKLAKTGSFSISAFYTQLFGHFSLYHVKRFPEVKHLATFSPYRLFIKFRVIRL